MNILRLEHLEKPTGDSLYNRESIDLDGENNYEEQVHVLNEVIIRELRMVKELTDEELQDRIRQSLKDGKSVLTSLDWNDDTNLPHGFTVKRYNINGEIEVIEYIWEDGDWKYINPDGEGTKALGSYYSGCTIRRDMLSDIRRLTTPDKTRWLDRSD